MKRPRAGLWLITAGLLVGAAPPGIEDVKRERLQMTRKSSPALYALDMRLLELQAEMGMILKRLGVQEIDEDAAKAMLRPLVTEERALQTNPDYLVEKKIAHAQGGLMMQKPSRMILLSGLILGSAGPGRAQRPPGPDHSAASPFQTPPGWEEVLRERERMIREHSPDLYAFQKRLQKLQAETRSITERLAAKSISRDSAKELLLPLVKEEQQIESDPDYLIEQKLAQVYLSSPSFQAKVNKIMLKTSTEAKKP